MIQVAQSIPVTPYWLGQRFIGMKEVPGKKDNPFILGMLQLDVDWPRNDETPWCSAFPNFINWQLRLPRSKDLRARSWLNVGESVPFNEAQVGFDLVVLTRGANAPGPEVIAAPGHVGYYGGRQDGRILLLGGNQGNQVSIAPFDASRLLGVRRVAPPDYLGSSSTR